MLCPNQTFQRLLLYYFLLPRASEQGHSAGVFLHGVRRWFHRALRITALMLIQDQLLMCFKTFVEPLEQTVQHQLQPGLSLDVSGGTVQVCVGREGRLSAKGRSRLKFCFCPLPWSG